jgi:hypothetical protein
MVCAQRHGRHPLDFAQVASNGRPSRVFSHRALASWRCPGFARTILCRNEPRLRLVEMNPRTADNFPKIIGSLENNSATDKLSDNDAC